MAFKRSAINAARRTRLEALGVVWKTPLEQQWDRGFELLTAFHEAARGALQSAMEARGAGREARVVVGDAAGGAQ
jgi:hypothetical protein